LSRPVVRESTAVPSEDSAIDCVRVHAPQRAWAPVSVSTITRLPRWPLAPNVQLLGDFEQRPAVAPHLKHFSNECGLLFVNLPPRANWISRAIAFAYCSV